MVWRILLLCYTSIETSHLVCTLNEIAGFGMKCITAEMSFNQIWLKDILNQGYWNADSVIQSFALPSTNQIQDCFVINIFKRNTGHWNKVSCIKSKIMFKVTIKHQCTEYAWPLLGQLSSSILPGKMENFGF